MAALVTDLKQRGLLDDTLVIWGGEFGRTPLRQGISGDGTATKPGRDHHKDAFTMLAGRRRRQARASPTAGPTTSASASVENPVHVHDLNATVLHLLGLDHERLTYRYQGREFRLTDVHGTSCTTCWRERSGFVRPSDGFRSSACAVPSSGEVERGRRAGRAGGGLEVVLAGEQAEAVQPEGDVGETHDRSARAPDVVEKLAAKLEAWEKQVSPAEELYAR